MPSKRLERSEPGSSAKEAEGGRSFGRRRGGEQDSDEDAANESGVAAVGRCRPRAALRLGVKIVRAFSMAAEEESADLNAWSFPAR